MLTVGDISDIFRNLIRSILWPLKSIFPGYNTREPALQA